MAVVKGDTPIIAPGCSNGLFFPLVLPFYVIDEKPRVRQNIVQIAFAAWRNKRAGKLFPGKCGEAAKKSVAHKNRSDCKKCSLSCYTFDMILKIEKGELIS